MSRSISNRAIGALGLGAAALLFLGSQRRSKSSDKYIVPESDWGSYRGAFERMSRGDYSSEEIDRIIKYQPLVEMYAQRYGVSPALVDAIIHVESRFRPDVQSPAGAQGLMQIMPSTWKYRTEKMGMTGDPFDPKANIQVGTDLIDWLFSAFQGQSDTSYKAIAAYNAGIGRVQDSVRDFGDEWFASLPAQTKAYVEAVTESWMDFDEVFRSAFGRGL